MTDEMNGLISAEAPGDAASLVGMEDAVWARINVQASRTRAEQVRFAVVALALGIGVANGGLMLTVPRPEPSEMRIFTVSAGLFPLTSLENRG